MISSWGNFENKSVTHLPTRHFVCFKRKGNIAKISIQVLFHARNASFVANTKLGAFFMSVISFGSEKKVRPGFHHQLTIEFTEPNSVLHVTQFSCNLRVSELQNSPLLCSPTYYRKRISNGRNRNKKKSKTLSVIKSYTLDGETEIQYDRNLFGSCDSHVCLPKNF